jgi:hypothetical protein
MAKVRQKAKKSSGLKKTVAKTAVKLRSKRSTPKEAKNHRKRVDVAVATTGSLQTPVLAAPAAAVAVRDRPGFPYLWPALGVMRMWLGPRKSGHA